MKKKILALCLVVVLAVTAVTSATLAYFSDTDAQKNTFTTGNVAIDLWEDFGDNDADGIEKLIPATGSAQKGTLYNGGFTAIFVCIILVPILEKFCKTKEEKQAAKVN